MRVLACLIILLLSSIDSTYIAHACAQSTVQVIPIWPDDTIGDHGTIAAERIREQHEAPTADALWITNVSKPTIKVFPVAAETNSGGAVIICPGGGYWNLAWDKEGEEIAAWANSVGMTGIVLKYRVPRRSGEPEPEPAPGPLLDAQRAISLVRSHSDDWGLDKDKIGIAGFSAGGHLAVMTAIQHNDRSYAAIDSIDDHSCKPDFAIVAYPGYITESPRSMTLADYIKVPTDCCPVFIVHATNDDEPGAPPEQSIALFGALRQAKIPVELHIYQEGKHGFGMRNSNLPVSAWPERCADWLKRLKIINSIASDN